MTHGGRLWPPLAAKRDRSINQIDSLPPLPSTTIPPPLGSVQYSNARGRALFCFSGKQESRRGREAKQNQASYDGDNNNDKRQGFLGPPTCASHSQICVAKLMLPSPLPPGWSWASERG